MQKLLPAKRRLHWLYRILLAFGFDPAKTFRALPNVGHFVADFHALKLQEKTSRRDFPFGGLMPELDDRSAESGSTSGHYFYQDWYVANRVFLNNPATHVDVGSRIDGFVTHVASFRKICVIDIRPLHSEIANIEILQADLMSPLQSGLDGCCDSLSCLHALEHFGLGRYGDPVQYDGHILGLENMARLLRTGGKFYLSVPIGPQRIEFNAHRIFSLRYLLGLLKDRFRPDQFSYVGDDGVFHANVPLVEAQIATNFGCSYGCGIFEMSKA